MEMLKFTGMVKNVLETNDSIKWSDLSLKEYPELPDEYEVEFTISLNHDDFLSGKIRNC
jgi:hypothetical protein